MRRAMGRSEDPHAGEKQAWQQARVVVDFDHHTHPPQQGERAFPPTGGQALGKGVVGPPIIVQREGEVLEPPQLAHRHPQLVPHPLPDDSIGLMKVRHRCVRVPATASNAGATRVFTSSVTSGWPLISTLSLARAGRPPDAITSHSPTIPTSGGSSGLEALIWRWVRRAKVVPGGNSGLDLRVRRENQHLELAAGGQARQQHRPMPAQPLPLAPGFPRDVPGRSTQRPQLPEAQQ
jgi:hypothetical protein